MNDEHTFDLAIIDITKISDMDFFRGPVQFLLRVFGRIFAILVYFPIFVIKLITFRLDWQLLLFISFKKDLQRCQNPASVNCDNYTLRNNDKIYDILLLKCLDVVVYIFNIKKELE